MTTTAQVTQIPARPALPSPGVGAPAQAASVNPAAPVTAAAATTTSASVSSAAATTTNALSSMTLLSSANQNLLQANPIGGASDAVSSVRSKVEAEGLFNKLHFLLSSIFLLKLYFCQNLMLNFSFL